ncbi:hypothetical protein ACFW9F_01840 [Streptomyces sp. NPDC059506]|uniref:hypothetical protein n=1 Tax=Streptomyces sp. NPDC059506 TaxID=3347751 RepID=UPI0036ABC3D5
MGRPVSCSRSKRAASARAAAVSASAARHSPSAILLFSSCGESVPHGRVRQEGMARSAAPVFRRTSSCSKLFGVSRTTL